MFLGAYSKFDLASQTRLICAKTTTKPIYIHKKLKQGNFLSLAINALYSTTAKVFPLETLRYDANFEAAGGFFKISFISTNVTGE